jgi:hypothetical protein
MIRKLVRKLIRYLSKKEKQERQYAIGISSYLNKGDKNELHVVILDYDMKDFSKVLKDVNELVKFFNLSSYECYSTRCGFHIFFWYDHVAYSRLKMIINYSNYIDPLYKFISTKYDTKVLRASGKYKDNDINFIGYFNGVRTATKDERELGNLKRKEYIELKKIKFQEEWLK